MTADLLNEKYAIANAVRFEKCNGLVCASLKSSSGEAQVFLHGGHVAHYQPRGQTPVLFVSAKSNFEMGKPIRGGVPVCWPWFGARGPEPTSPMHGFARSTEWEVESTNDTSGTTSITLALKSNDQTMTLWPHEFELRHTIALGDALEMRLTTRNLSSQAFSIEEALHTYLAVSDVRQVLLTGLAGTYYQSKVAGQESQVQQAEPLQFTQETDRVYMNTPATCVVSDAAWGRKIEVSKKSSGTTVVWNPWIGRAKALPDFGDDEWPGMLCVETANTHASAVKLAPGHEHTMMAVVRAMPM